MIKKKDKEKEVKEERLWIEEWNEEDDMGNLWDPYNKL